MLSVWAIRVDGSGILRSEWSIEKHVRRVEYDAGPNCNGVYKRKDGNVGKIDKLFQAQKIEGKWMKISILYLFGRGTGRIFSSFPLPSMD